MRILSQTENTTYGIDLSRDWTNSSLEMIQTKRPSNATPLGNEALWYDDKNNTIYCFGGERSFATDKLTALEPPPDAIWGFSPNGEGSGAWHEVLGPNTLPFPNDIHRSSGGASATDGSSAYHLGGFQSYESDKQLNQARFSPDGLLKFDFDTYQITNASAQAYLSTQTPGPMINIPSYGDNGILVILPTDNGNVGFNNITLYDKTNQKWHYQVASGDDVPPIRSAYCAVGIESDEEPYFEM